MSLRRSTPLAYLWARNNLSSIAAVSGNTESPFPSCASSGGPFYHDCSVPILNLASTSYAVARDWVRARSGWEQAVNDVRDAAQ